jgi:hypothetical protein
MSNMTVAQQPKPKPAPDPRGLRVKVTFAEKLNPFVRLGHLSHADGWLRPDGLVRVDYQPERPDADFDHVLVPLAQVAAMAVYRDG